MKILSKNYNDLYFSRIMSKEIAKVMTDDFVIANIGTDKQIYDSLGGLVGTILKEKKYKGIVYGTIKDPIHARNIENKLDMIKANHPNSTILAIDACVGISRNIGDIELRKSPIHPGKGAGKDLPPVGDYSITGITITDRSEIYNTRLDLIYDMAKVIADSIIKAERSYIRNKNKKIEQEAAATA